MSAHLHETAEREPSILSRLVDGRLERGVLAVVAHPDDETLGAGICLARNARASIVHVTDGAPRSGWFSREAGCQSRAEYALLRARELTAALDALRLRPRARYSMGAVDQEAIEDFLRLFRSFCAVLASDRFDVVLTHPYEGGHPDHDATAFLVHTAVARLRERRGTAPIVVEMAGYHAGVSGDLVVSRFLRRGQGAQGTAGIEVHLSAEERARKENALACFASQRKVVERFDHDCERFRIAPTYDFELPPHEEPLHYEQLDWPMTGQRFRGLVRKARQKLAALEPTVTWH